MTPYKAAEEILLSLQSRKGFPAFLATIAPEVVERMVGEWAGIISQTKADAWQPIDSAPQDGTRVIGLGTGRYDSGVDVVWWQEEFDGWIKGARIMVMAPGYTIDGKTEKLHSPEMRTPTHWMPWTPPTEKVEP